MSISNVIALLGGVALFLFGMALMGDSLKKVAGNKLELVLYRLTSNPLKGVLLGTGITAIIQSSSATSVMVVGFVNAEMMKLRQAIGIILGAFLGTSITGWIICLSDLGGAGTWASLFSTSTLTALVAVVGIVIRMVGKKQTTVHTADILLGFAVLMFGMSAMSGAVEPLRGSEQFVSLLTHFSNPLLGILVGAAFTAVIQSSSAAVGILQALSVTGAIPFSVAAPVIMGIAIGAAVPVLLSSIGASLNARRSAFVYLVIDVVGVGICSVLLYGLNAFLHFSFMEQIMNTVSIAVVNTIFRLITLLALTPCIGLVEKLLCWLLPGKAAAPAAADVALPDIELLEERFLEHPSLAIEQSRIAVNNMALRAQDNFVTAFELLKQFSESGFAAVQEAEEIVDKYEDRLGTYLVQITRLELTTRQTSDVSKFLHTIGDFERISDHALNLAETAREIHDKRIVFTKEAQEELDVTCAAVGEILSLAIGAFMYNDMEQAVRVEPLEELIDNLCDEMKLHHIDRLKDGTCTLSHGFVFNDLLTNLERTADHCSNVAVAMIELESASFDTHEYLSSVKRLHDGAFSQYYDEYSAKFSF